MTTLGRLLVPAAALVAAGCASNQQFLDGKQATAVQAALGRARFEMACPEATGTVISREVVQPVLQGPLARGPERAEFTVGVSGCGNRATYLVVCPDGSDGCFAAGNADRLGDRRPERPAGSIAPEPA
jgi:hypothetical protein